MSALRSVMSMVARDIAQACPATIAHGDGICATHVTAASLVPIRDTTISTAADKPTTESGGIFA